MRPSAGVAAGIVIVVLSSSPSAAQDIGLSVPLEYVSGFSTGQEPKAFAGGIRTGVLARLGSEGTILGGLAGGLLYDGASWTAAAGARFGMRVPGLGVRDAGVYVFAEGLKGKGRAPISVAVVADLPVRPALFGRFGLSFTRDVDRGHNEIALQVGVDLARWAVDLLGGDGPRGVDP
jgi:hypothetical protein